jgi:hypothetical protein
MNFNHMQHIPLASAYLCPDCNCIGNCASQCPACASPVLLALANVLDRKRERDSALPYDYNNRHAGRRAFLVAGRLRAVRSHTTEPTPISVNSGARAHAPWRVVQRDMDEEGVFGLGEGAAS